MQKLYTLSSKTNMICSCTRF